MPEPVIENIEASLLTTLNTITTDNGFYHSLSWYRAARIDFLDKAPNEFVGIIRNTDAALAVEPGTLTSEWEQNFELEVILPEDNTSRAANRVFSDIQKKINTDRTFQSGMLPGSHIDGYTLNSEASRVTIIVNFKVHYRTQFADPETAV